MRIWVAVVVGLCCWWGGQGAQAQTSEDTARKLYEDGVAAYQLTKYDQAIQNFEAAYELTRAPLLLFNIAQAYRLKGDCERALRFYKNYLVSEPKTQNQAGVEKSIREMESCVDREHAKTHAQAPGAPRWLPWAVGATGLALAIAGTVLIVHTRGEYDRLSDLCHDGCSPADIDGLDLQQTVGWGLIGVGGAALAGGIVLWLVRPTAQGRAWLRPTVGGLAIGGQF